MEALLVTESEFYKEHRQEFLEAYRNQYLLIYGESLEGVYDTQDEAINEGYKRHGQGPYLVRKAGDSAPLISNPALTLGVPLARNQPTV